MRYLFILIFILPVSLLSNAQENSFTDTTFWQEYHSPYPVTADNMDAGARSIAVDKDGNVWIATKSGVLLKKANEKLWSSPFPPAENGPAFSIATNNQGDVWMGTWKGVYSFKNNSLKLLNGTEGPIAAVCTAKEGLYAAGPKGLWRYNGQSFVKLNYAIGRSVRKIISDNNYGVWVATDVGLYHCTPNGLNHFVDTTYLVSAYINGLAIDAGNRLWAGGLGGVSILYKDVKEKVILPKDGCPSRFVNCLKKDENGTIWIGTNVGIARFSLNGKHSLLFSRRWLLDDHVNDIAFDADGNAWVATDNGVSAIMKKKMTLAGKQDYFYDVLMKRHIRAPWIAGYCRLTIPGDVNSWQPEDDDNDGEYTGNYLAMESFRYATTKDDDAREKAKKAYHFLQKLEEITGGDGYFARTIVPVEWGDRVHDPNRTYTERELADEMVIEPRNKPVEIRWRKSADGKWLWKGDASSDEWCGHMMGYYFYYELAADEAEKEQVRTHVAKLVDHLIAHNFNMVDVDGTHTRWSVWSPESLNRDPEWQPDQYQNSMELLAFLKLAYYMTGKMKYQENYLRLIKEEHYLDNMAKIFQQNPGWFIYFDVSLQAYIYPILLHCEKDPELLAFYQQHLEQWMARRINDKNPLLNFLYCYAANKQRELPASIDFLTDTPLDLIDWHIDHTKREDITLVHEPVLNDLQVNVLPPASIRMVVRWDKNPWNAVGGHPTMEREPVFWLLPYWMGRYLKMIRK
ncbi:ligand-binding sensor domain-containing protein [Flavihumibacter profundi]|uniref:ligand-binding sensor domain-containing protein n=1 Tax=Flavihumibacter profundi TaxID=2716883 RepID=UPI001CC78F6B|nr:two-component regulator propeller domain-containing protein [Flavihumibacter profundi]MBZ5856005.1 hypothetical protein [Flavihumibacter profundi]